MENLEQKIIEILASKSISGKRIALYGCSDETSILLDVIKKAGLEVEVQFILDGDFRKNHSFYDGVEVRLPSETISEKNDLTVIIWSLYADAMIACVSKYILSREQIIHIDIRRDSPLYLEYQIYRIKKALKSFELIKKNESQYYLLAPVASGDIYIALAFLKEWKQKNGVADITLIGSGRNIEDIADLYGIKNVEIINDKTRRDLAFLSSALGGQLNLKMLSPWELWIRNSFFPYGKSCNTFVEKFKYEVFGLERENHPIYPNLNGKMGGHPPKAVIAPYAYSSPAPQLSKEIWSKIAAAITDRGYRVYTVGYGDMEPAIAGTTLIRFAYKDIPDIFSKDDLFIAERSGLCDIMHNSPCNKLILFSNTKNKYAMDLFGMKRNYSDFAGEELLVSGIKDEEIAETVVRKLTM